MGPKGSFYFLLVFMGEIMQIQSEVTIKRSPNIVMIAVNQFGMEDFRLHLNRLHHIQNLANDSVWFSHVYSHLYPTSSRAALLTGKLPVKTGMLKGRFMPFTCFPSLASSGGLPLAEDTIAEVLQNNGYLNKFIGLWDLGLGKNGQFLPLEQGFQSWYGILALPTEKCSLVSKQAFHKHIYDEVALFLCLLLTLVFGTVALLYLKYLRLKYILYGFTLATIMYASSQGFSGMSYIKLRSCVLFRDGNIIAQPYNGRNLTARFTEEAVNFINHRTVATVPFFLMLNHVLFSKPLFNSEGLVSTSNDTFLDSLNQLDLSVGMLQRALEEANITDDTIIMFMSLSGINYAAEDTVSQGFFDNWENNTVVPLFIKLPNNLTSTRKINTTISLIDVMPTLLELASISYRNEKLDGVSFLPAMIDDANFSEPLHKFFFHYYDVTRPSAVTHGNYKAFFSTSVGDSSRINHDPPLLYDLSTDPHETSPLPNEEHQEIISTISDAVEKHLENRTRKWISQFEHPILPWLFPCADFPYCYKLDDHRTDMKLN